MTERMPSGSENLCRWWPWTVLHLALWQWKVVDAQWRAGIVLMKTLTGECAGEDRTTEDKTAAVPRQTPAEFEELRERAAERVRQGAAPPREVYEVQNRSRIDWSLFPEWARPSDPELYEGCAHEG
jgi:hypothetical protein